MEGAKRQRTIGGMSAIRRASCPPLAHHASPKVIRGNNGQHQQMQMGSPMGIPQRGGYVPNGQPLVHHQPAQIIPGNNSAQVRGNLKRGKPLVSSFGSNGNSNGNCHPVPVQVATPQQETPSPFAGMDGEKLYFDSYAHIAIHEAMLRDTTRTETYYNAIMKFKHLFENAVVIDVGSGTGILSIFSAWAGARKVYSIEASSLAEQTKDVMIENGLQDVVTVIHGKVEDAILVDENGDKIVADIIISEWMGYFLYYEAMFDSVLYARDTWLRPEGAMFPSHAVLYLSPLTDDQFFADRILFWENVYGATMTSMMEHAKRCAFDNVLVDAVQPCQVFASSEIIKFVDCRTCCIKEVQTWRAGFQFSSTIVTNFHGFLGHFDVLFAPNDGRVTRQLYSPPANRQLQPEVQMGEFDTPLTNASQILLHKLRVGDPSLKTAMTLSTSPMSTLTHWQHCCFFTGDQLLVVQDQQIVGEIEVCQNNENNRFIDISMNWTICDVPQAAPKFRPTARMPMRQRGTGAGYPAQQASIMPEPDMVNQIEEANPPRDNRFAHTKVYGFK